MTSRKTQNGSHFFLAPKPLLARRHIGMAKNEASLSFRDCDKFLAGCVLCALEPAIERYYGKG